MVMQQKQIFDQNDFLTRCTLELNSKIYIVNIMSSIESSYQPISCLLGEENIIFSLSMLCIPVFA
jgi:hypothetical protein